MYKQVIVVLHVAVHQQRVGCREYGRRLGNGETMYRQPDAKTRQCTANQMFSVTPPLNMPDCRTGHVKNSNGPTVNLASQLVQTRHINLSIVNSFVAHRPPFCENTSNQAQKTRANYITHLRSLHRTMTIMITSTKENKKQGCLEKMMISMTFSRDLFSYFWTHL